MKNYLLDTNCFYDISKGSTHDKKIQRKLNSIKESIVICPIVILEIVNCEPKNSDFVNRKRAMAALLNVKSEIYQDTPDDVISKAFSQKPLQLDNKVDWGEIINTFLLANSYSEAKDGVLDYKNKRTLKLDFELINQWKQSFQEFFINSIQITNKEARQRVKDILSKYDLDKLTRKELSELILSNSLEGQNVYDYILSGLAVRAGIITEFEYEKLVDANDITTIQEFIVRIKKTYNKTLETYLKVFIHYRRTLLKNSYSPEKNDIFDLDFFSYMDIFSNCFFVTSEKQWIENYKTIIPDRVIKFEEFIKMI